MELNKIRTQLEEDIKKLSDYRGFILAGLPRFNNLFGRDSLIVSWQLLNYDPSIAKVTLKTLAYLQASKIDPERDAEPGKILHEMWEGDDDAIPRLNIDAVPFPYYGSVDSTPLFMIVAGKYFKKTKDADLIKRIWPKVVAAKDWIMTYGDSNKDGFVDFDRKNPHGPFNRCWKDGAQSPRFGKRPIAAVEVQGYKYEALRYFNILAEAIGEKEKIEIDYLVGFRKSFFEKFFWPEENFFYLAIDGKGKSYRSVTSNPGHLLFTGLIDAESKRKIVDRLFKPDMWTPFGVRTHSTNNKDFDAFSYQLGSVWPYDNWIIAEGLRESGFEKESNLIKDALVGAFSALGHLPELYAVDERGKIQEIKDANPLQAWSSGGLLNLIL
ncbi:MAG: hypothetical protein M1155_00490 [Patescibacteria group bacterium]|nr:hypothetical protein [Patescibacteria group bacterium]